MVSRPICTDVSASISTPVLPVVSTWARQWTLLAASSTSKSTVTRVKASGWHRGIRSLVRFAAMMAAMRAMPSTSPFLALPETIRARVAGCMRMVPAATALRRVSSLPPTSTIWACPVASKWLSFPAGACLSDVVMGLLRVRRMHGSRQAPSSLALEEYQRLRGIISPVKSKPTHTPSPGNAGTASFSLRLRASVLAPLLAALVATPLVHADAPTTVPVKPAISWTPLAVPPAPNLPNLGDTSREDLSPAMERKVGEEIMRDLRGDRDYLDDAPLLEYMNTFGNALVAARPSVRGETSYDYSFFVVRDPQLNAFALPGGFIGVHSALLLAAQSEAELASVLAHEIGHVAQRHIARMLGQQRQDALLPLAAILLAALASRAGGDAAIGVFAAGQGLAIQRQLNFGRDAEREADRIGFQIMGEAGFDTTGMVAFFGRMQAASRSYSDLVPAYLQTHPLTTERIADILARARARVLQDESMQGLLNAQAYFKTQLELQSRFQLTAAHYGLAFVAIKQGKVAEAQAELDAANAALYKPAASNVFTSAGTQAPNSLLAAMALEVLLMPGQKPEVAEQAMKEADAARQKFPLSRGIAYQYAEAQIAAGKLEQAILYLRDQVQLYREEPALYDLLAKAYAGQGKMTLQHMALAESYVLQGATMAALDQLTIARKSTDATFYDQAVIDARERELQEKRREQIKDQKG